MSVIRIIDIHNSNCWYRQFELLISTIIAVLQISTTKCRYQQFELRISAIRIVDYQQLWINVNWACHRKYDTLVSPTLTRAVELAPALLEAMLCGFRKIDLNTICVNTVFVTGLLTHGIVYPIIRPPGTVVPDGLLFYRRCFFFRQPNLRGPSADRRETLPHDRNLVAIAG